MSANRIRPLALARLSQSILLFREDWTERASLPYIAVSYLPWYRNSRWLSFENKYLALSQSGAKRILQTRSRLVCWVTGSLTLPLLLLGQSVLSFIHVVCVALIVHRNRNTSSPVFPLFPVISSSALLIRGSPFRSLSLTKGLQYASSQSCAAGSFCPHCHVWPYPTPRCSVSGLLPGR